MRRTPPACFRPSCPRRRDGHGAFCPRRIALGLALTMLAGLLTIGPQARPAHADDAAEAPPAPTEVGRLRAIKGLRSKLRRAANSPHAAKKGEEIDTYLTSLDSLGGWEAGRAALEGAVLASEDLRLRIFGIVEREHDPKLVAPLVALLEAKRHRRDHELKKHIAHALAVMADVKAIEPLTALIRTDEHAEVVDEAAQALATFAAVPINHRRQAVRRLVDLYATTYTLMMSIRPEDRLLRQRMGERYEVYGKTLRRTLQALTSQQISRPAEWRRWWNKNKKAHSWRPGRR